MESGRQDQLDELRDSVSINISKKKVTIQYVAFSYWQLAVGFPITRKWEANCQLLKANC
ncbi:MAG: hypothetical protein ACI8YQ_001831 [Polaribacter sp.]|jgi:hypothetical protein